MKNSKFKIALTTFDKWVEIISLLLIVVLWIATAYIYTAFTGIIPIHFDEDGNPDNYGSKAAIFLLPIIGTAVFILLTALNKYPLIFNYSVTITDENRKYQYQNAIRMLRCLKLSIAIICTIITIEMYLSGSKKTYITGSWFLIMIFLVINIPVAYFIMRMFMKPKAPTQNNAIDGPQKN